MYENERLFTDPEERFAPPLVLVELGESRCRWPPVNEVFLGGDIGMGSGRLQLLWGADAVGIVLFATWCDVEDELLYTTELDGDLALAVAGPAALDSESEPESHASSSPHSFVADETDHLDGTLRDFKMCGRAGGAVIAIDNEQREGQVELAQPGQVKLTELRVTL